MAGLDAFLIYELEETQDMNMNEIESILYEMGCNSFSQKIRISNHYSDIVWVEYIYVSTLSKYRRVTLDDDEDLQPQRKK
jgi:hypothetical protein